MRKPCRHWVTTAKAGCDDGVCEFEPEGAYLFSDGSFTWWVLTWSDAGHGPWSVPLVYIIQEPPAPTAATLVAPNGDSNAAPTYVWEAVPSSTWYWLWVDGPSGNAIAQWYTSAAAGCVDGAGQCSVTSPVALGSGSHIWWIQTWNNFDYGPWSSGMTFNVSE